MLAKLLGLCGLATLLLGTFLIVRGKWGDIEHVAWLMPGAKIVSIEFGLFVVTSAAFVIGGALAGSRTSAGMFWTSGGFLFAMTCSTCFGTEGVDDDGMFVPIVFFIIPAAWFILGGLSTARVWDRWSER